MKKNVAFDNDNLKAVIVYDPVSNSRDAAILDVKSGLILGMPNNDRPYYPCGGMEAVDSIIDYGGFVKGSNLNGYECWNCHDNVYRLGKKPESSFETALAS